MQDQRIGPITVEKLKVFPGPPNIERPNNVTVQNQQIEGTVRSMNIVIRHFLWPENRGKQLDECPAFRILLEQLRRLSKDISVPYILWDPPGFMGFAWIDGYDYDYDVDSKRMAFLCQRHDFYMSEDQA